MALQFGTGVLVKCVLEFFLGSEGSGAPENA
jgi:hypothetical protein